MKEKLFYPEVYKNVFVMLLPLICQNFISQMKVFWKSLLILNLKLYIIQGY